MAAMLSCLFGTSTRPPILLKVRSSETFIIFTVATAIFTDVFIYGIIVPVLPFALTERVAISPDDIQRWISILLAVYGAALLLAAPFCGWIADRLESRRWPLLFGLLALGGATVMLCVGDNIGIFAAGRVLQGISAAVVWVVGLALLVDTVGPDNIGTAMGYVGLSMSLSYLCAPLLGGVVFAQSGYYSVWAMAFGLIVLDIVLRVALIEKKVARQWLTDKGNDGNPERVSNDEETARKVEDEEVIELPVDVDKILPTKEAPHEANDLETGRPPMQRNHSLATSTAAVTAAESLSTRTPALVRRIVQHLPPVVFLLGSRRVLSAIFCCTMQSALLTSFDALLPLFVRETFHWNSIGAGLLFISLVVPSFASPVVGHYADKYGPRILATTGFLVCGPFYILLRLVHKDTMGQKVLLCALLTFIGFGLMLAFTPLMAEIAYAVDAKSKRRPPGFFGKNGAYAQAFSLFNMAWAAGCFLGPLLSGLVNQAKGWGTTTLILGCISFFTAAPTLYWTGGSLRRRNRLGTPIEHAENGHA